MKDERRAFERTRYFGEVELDGLLKARLSDVSPEGAFVESRTGFTPGAVIHLRFNVLGREVETAAEIRHCSPGIGIGVKFIDLDPAVRTEIARLLASTDHAAPEASRRPRPGEKVATMCPECEWHQGVSVTAIVGTPPALVSLRCSGCSASWSVALATLVPAGDAPDSPWRLEVRQPL